MSGEIENIWLQQPLAFARAGSSPTPLDAFEWTEPDLRPHGTGRSAISPARSFTVERDGLQRATKGSQSTLFRDEHGIRPVCPFFELHGRCNGVEQPITPSLLIQNGFSSASVTWSIEHANLKAFALTDAEGDRIDAFVENVTGDDYRLHPLMGHSPVHAPEPLVPVKPGIHMGAIQVVRSGPTDPIRLRFFAPKGNAYGPSDLKDRLDRSTGLIDLIIGWIGLNADWKGFDLPGNQLFLNPKAEWLKYRLLTWGEFASGLPRNLWKLRAFSPRFFTVQRSELVRLILGPYRSAGKLPPALFAFRYGGGALLTSLGIVDDLGDGIISCKFGKHEAKARVVVAPPHFSPDRRPVLSIADVLTDRMLRDDVRQPGWVNNWNQASDEIHDLLDRAYDSAGSSNMDVSANAMRLENEWDAKYRGDPYPPPKPANPVWPDRSSETVLPLPLTEQARWRHRRNAAFEIFEQFLRDDRDFMAHVRDPDDAEALYYDKRMPALMRGSDRRPMHLTRRQIGALRAWLKRLKEHRLC